MMQNQKKEETNISTMKHTKCLTSVKTGCGHPGHRVF